MCRPAERRRQPSFKLQFGGKWISMSRALFSDILLRSCHDNCPQITTTQYCADGRSHAPVTLALLLSPLLDVKQRSRPDQAE